MCSLGREIKLSLQLESKRKKDYEMRNLELLRSFPCLELAGVNGSLCFTVDSESGVVYTANSLAVTGFQPSCQQVCPLKHGCYPEYTTISRRGDE